MTTACASAVALPAPKKVLLHSCLCVGVEFDSAEHPEIPGIVAVLLPLPSLEIALLRPKPLVLLVQDLEMRCISGHHHVPVEGFTSQHTFLERSSSRQLPFVPAQLFPAAFRMTVLLI